MEDLNKEEEVVLVDEDNNVLGYVGKLEAHQKALLHRAISVIIFNSKGEQLVQQRAFDKYHFAGLWSNTCCSHPRKDESFQQAAERRLWEEIGIKTPLTEQFYFIYKAHDEKSGLTEWEYDTVFTGIYEEPFEYNKAEVNDVKWMSTAELEKEFATNGDNYSFWYKIIFEEMKKRGTISK
jgi:isopentenyl-diphosphate delta-isomerase